VRVAESFSASGVPSGPRCPNSSVTRLVRERKPPSLKREREREESSWDAQVGTTCFPTLIVNVRSIEHLQSGCGVNLSRISIAAWRNGKRRRT
jgi:hypothetical protein